MPTTDHLFALVERLRTAIPDVRRALLAALAEGLLDAADDDLEAGIDAVLACALLPALVPRAEYASRAFAR